MSNNAFINFLFNADGATKGIVAFQNDFVHAIETMTSSATKLMTGFGDILGNTISPKKFFSDIMEMRRVSEAYKVPIEQISKMNNLLHIFGGNTQDTIGLIEGMGNSIAQVLKGQNADYFGKFGIEITDSSGKTKNPIQILQEIRKRYQSMNQEGQQALLSHFGLAGNKAIVEYLSAEENYLAKFTGLVDGLTYTDKETSERMKRISDSMGALSLLWNNTYNDLANSPLGELIDGLAKSITDYATASPENAEKIKKVMSAIMVAGVVINQLPRYIPLFKFIAGFASSTAALVALGVALGYIAYQALGGYEGIDNLLKSWDEWIAKVKKDHPVLGKALEIIKEIAAWILDPVGQLGKVADSLEEKFSIKLPNSLDQFIRIGKVDMAKAYEEANKRFSGQPFENEKTTSSEKNEINGKIVVDVTADGKPLRTVEYDVASSVRRGA